MVLTETFIPLVTCVNISIIGKDTSRERNYDREKGQDHKNGVQKDVFHNSFKSSLSIKFSHCLIEVKTENQKKDSWAVNIEYGIQWEAKDEQDKQEWLIMKAKYEMIGVGIVISDVNHGNEQGEYG